MNVQKTLYFLFVLMVTIACKKNNISDNARPKPDSIKTAKGVANGPASTKIIGSSGGEIMSSDGNVKIVVPAGAVPTNTEFSIQPITNTLFEGEARSAYRLLPEGSNFAKPVRLQFRYTHHDTLHTTEDLLTVASQRADGAWAALPARLDKSAKMLTVETVHFSDWTVTGGLYLTARKTELGLGEKTMINVVSVREDGELGPLIPQLESEDKDKVESIGNWEIVSGFGGISVEAGQLGKLQTEAEYGAPENMTPNRRIMTISVDVTGYNLIKDPAAPGGVRRLNKMILFEHITVVKEYIKAVIAGKTYLFTGTETTAVSSNGALLISAKNAELNLNISILGDKAGTYNCNLHTGVQAFITQGSRPFSTAYLKCNGAGAFYANPPIVLTKVGKRGEWIEGKFSGSLFDNLANACTGPVPTAVTELAFHVIRKS